MAAPAAGQTQLAEILRTRLPRTRGVSRVTRREPRLELCAEHVRQFEGESPLPNLMEVKG